MGNVRLRSWVGVRDIANATHLGVEEERVLAPREGLRTLVEPGVLGRADFVVFPVLLRMSRVRCVLIFDLLHVETRTDD